MASLEIYLFGATRVAADGQVLPGFGRGKMLALLVYLVTRSGNPSHRDALAELLWPETSVAKARHSLRQSLVTLRDALDVAVRDGGSGAGSHPVLVTDDWIEFHGGGNGGIAWSDIWEFSELLDACDGHAHRRLAVCPSCARRMERAVELYRGDFCAWVSLGDNAEFEDWVLVQREHFRRRAVHALMGLAGYYAYAGAFEHAEHAVRHWLELDPWSENAHRQLMQVIWQQGDRSGALLQYERCRQVLEEHLGIVPEAETIALAEEIRHGQKPARDGEPNRAGAFQYHLPERRTPLVGREDELNRIADLLAMTECRLLTLTGLGGVGKTTLAIQAARELAGQFADGACFISFTSVMATDLVIPTIRQALGITFGGGANAETHLLNWLHHREVLLVFDNMEQVPDGGRIVASILQHTLNVRLLVTSRTRLNVPDEWIVEVEGLEVPVVDTGTDSEFVNAPACQLFMQVVQRLAPHVQLRPEDRPFVFSICRMVEGLPLAIELAAAWAPVLTVQDIAEELERGSVILESTLQELPARHQNMRVVFDQSWSMLPEVEQAILQRLSVFRGGFLRPAAECVADASLSGLSMLVNSSFLRQDSSGRYSFHGLLRQFGDRLLQENPEDQRQAQERHCLYYLGFLRQREAALMGRRQKQALREIAPEIGNIRVAWRWAVAQRRIDELSGAMQALWLFCVERGWMEEGQIMFGLLVDALDNPAADSDPVLSVPPLHDLALAKALVRQGGYRCGLGRYAEGMALLKRGIGLFRQLDAPQELALALNFLAAAIHVTGTIELERETLEESLALFRDCNSAWGMGYSLNDLGMVAHELGDDDLANRFCQESLGLFRSLGERRGLALVLSNLGIMAADRGDRREAESLFRESLSLRRATEDRWGITVSLTQLGIAFRTAGSHAESDTCFREALQTGMDGMLLPAVLDVLIEWAILRAAEGRFDQALDIVTVILDHPSAHARIQDRALLLRTQTVERRNGGADRVRSITFDDLVSALLAA